MYFVCKYICQSLKNKKRNIGYFFTLLKLHLSFNINRKLCMYNNTHIGIHMSEICKMVYTNIRCSYLQGVSRIIIYAFLAFKAQSNIYTHIIANDIQYARVRYNTIKRRFRFQQNIYRQFENSCKSCVCVKEKERECCVFTNIIFRNIYSTSCEGLQNSNELYFFYYFQYLAHNHRIQLYILIQINIWKKNKKKFHF